MSKKEVVLTEIYDDCNSQGEIMATWRTENICLRCTAAGVCIVANATQVTGACFVVVHRCCGFAPADQ